MSYFNEDQEDHMRSLASVPREDRCPSGWHVRPESGRRSAESCNCKPSPVPQEKP
jgi:hypothetical protein